MFRNWQEKMQQLFSVAMYDETSSDSVMITVIATGLDQESKPASAFSSNFGASATPSFLKNRQTTPQKSGLSF